MGAVAILAAFSMAAAGCGGGGSSSSNTSTSTTTTTSSDNGATASTTTTTTTAATGNIPHECQEYLDAVQACVNHLSSSNPAVATQFRNSMDQTRATWSSITDQAALASACTTAKNAFTSTSHAMGC